MDVVEFRAMGSPCRIVVDGGRPGLAADARSIVETCERRWSRFRPGSEISAINGDPSALHLVSVETFRLFELAAAAHEASAGRYHPLLLDHLEALGYDRSWELATRAVREPIPAVPDMEVELYPDLPAVRIPGGHRFDPGGIGKGLAADLATEFLTRQGARTTSVELGGDLRVSGTPWYGDSWRIGVADPFDLAAEVAAFTPPSGAVATSSRLGKRWTHGDRELHHLLDPRTGHPAATGLVAASVCASTAVWAEVAAKCAVIAGPADALDVIRALGGVGIVVDERGQVRATDRAATRTGVTT